MAKDTGKMGIRRHAIILSLCTVADCPIEAVCINRDAETRKVVVCGHYGGSTTNELGSQVYCGYLKSY